MCQKETLRRRYELFNPIELREIIKRQTIKLNRYKQEIEDLKGLETGRLIFKSKTKVTKLELKSLYFYTEKSCSQIITFEYKA